MGHLLRRFFQPTGLGQQQKYADPAQAQPFRTIVDDKKLLGAGTQTNDYSFGRDKTLSLPQRAVTG